MSIRLHKQAAFDCTNVIFSVFSSEKVVQCFSDMRTVARIF